MISRRFAAPRRNSWRSSIKRFCKRHRWSCFTAGSLDADQAAQQLAQAFAERPEIDQLITPKTQVLRVPKHEQLRYITEEEPVAQGKLTIGLRTGITANDPEYPAMIVFNSCFGGSTASRLFCHVREKMSLCYYASSQTEKTKGVMAVTSGIENDSEEPGSHRDFAPIGRYSGGRLDAGGSGQRQALDLCVAAHHV